MNGQNDGWDAFTASVFDDDAYVQETVAASAVGACSVAKDTIYFNSGEVKNRGMIFTKDSSGCMDKAGLVSQNNFTEMRVIFDSLFCAGGFQNPDRSQVGKFAVPATATEQ